MVASALLEAKDENLRYNKAATFFFQDHMIDPVTGMDISRDKYPRHLEVMKATKDFNEIAVIAPNRTGKTEEGSYITKVLVTKDYPDWWEGRRLPPGPKEFIVVGKTNLATRNVLQKKLLGEKSDLGTGMIPLAERNNGVGIVRVTAKAQPSGAIQDAFIRDVNGDINRIQFLSRDQSEGVMMGMELDFAWFDEDDGSPQAELWYQETLARMTTTNGLILNTFTPWPDGMTPSIMRFMPGRKFPADRIVRNKKGENTGRFCINFSLDDAPHLTPKMKQFMLDKYVGAERDARCFGIRNLGRGSIYPIDSNRLVVPPFPIPEHWPRAYGLDFGHEETAAVWVACDPQTDTHYVYAEYHLGAQTPYQHVENIKAKCIDSNSNKIALTGVCDPSGGGRYKETTLLVDEFQNLGLDLTPGNNALVPGVTRVLNRATNDRLKVFATCPHFIDEWVLYHYDDHGKPARNQDDHELDAYRYLESRFDYVAKSVQEITMEEYNINEDPEFNRTRDSWTGY